LTGIKHLKTKEDGSYNLLGMLTKMSSGELHLEDPDDDIRLTFAPELIKGEGMYTENCVVVAKGELKVGVEENGKFDGICFHVKAMFHPTPEARALTEYVPRPSSNYD
jgi:hypothetical protein